MKNLSKHFLFFAALSMVVTPLGQSAEAASKEPKVKYEKTELEKASGKCLWQGIAAVFVGALVGTIVAGRKKRGKGAALGAGAGLAIAGVNCALVRKAAKKKQAMIDAQIATAQFNGENYRTNIDYGDGETVTFVGERGDEEKIDGDYLRPVKFQSIAMGKTSSPVLPKGSQFCRQIDSGVIAADGSQSLLPTQLTCRDSNGDWYPYSSEI